jgi:alkanesulfonate monooxygenase SsuD/methylene tetrahydromethanopterin reductase-like flavin-dependent oxidoreductase (luciferase family)
VLSAAAAVTKTLKLGTGVCLVVQRDPIQTAKLVASIDQVSNGRFLFGVGGGWNAEEIEDHGRPSRPALSCARADRGNERDLDPVEARISPRVRQFPADDDLAKARSETAPADHRWWRAFPHAARRAVRYGDGWVPIAGRTPYGEVNEYLPKFKQMVAEAGRDPTAVLITLFGGVEDADLLKRYRDMGVERVVTTLPPEPADKNIADAR